MAVVGRTAGTGRLADARRFLHEKGSFAAAVFIGALFAVAVGGAVAAGGGRAYTAVVASLGVAGATAFTALRGHRLERAMAVEVPVILMLVSNQVLRVRTAADIAANPVDTAGAFRVGCIGLAALLGVAALLLPRDESIAEERLTTRQVRLYIAYVVVVFAGAPLSVDLPLTAYRGIELATAVIVLLGAWNVLGSREATRRVGNVLYWFVVSLVGTVWLAAVVAPGHAFAHFQDLSVPIPYALQGVFPSMSFNTVGFLGVMLTLWSLGRVSSRDPQERLRPATGYLLTLLGFATLLAAQYRTGYVAFVLGLLVFLALRRKWAVLWVLGISIAMVLVLVPSFVTTAKPYALRGTRSVNVATLDSRTIWWGLAIKVWKEDPILGRGLLTATRFEIFEPLGLGNVSTIHSTWVEALVGTGLVGITVLGLSVLVTLKRATVDALRRDRSIIPLVLLLVLLVRGLTGATFEVFQLEAVLYLWVAFRLRSDTASPSIA
jgi:O-antigen ligase